MAENADLTADLFLGGRLSVLQPRTGYRAGADAVLLAAAVPAGAGDSVLELGLGVGVASLCLARRVADLSLTGVERDPETAALARRNARENGIPLDVITTDIATLPASLRVRSFDHVLMNPPFFRQGTRASQPARAGARHEETPLDDWIDAGLRRLAPRGWLTLIHQTARLPDALAAIGARAGGIVVRPLAGRAGAPADRMILSARKGSRAAFRLLPPFVMHEGDRHLTDADSHTPAARAVLWDGAALD